MRALRLLPLVLAASAFVVPDQETLNSLTIEKQEPATHSILEGPLESWEELEDGFTECFNCAGSHFDDPLQSLSEETAYYSDNFENAFDGKAWLDSAEYDLDLVDYPPPHHCPPGHPKHPRKPPHKKPPHNKPHHGHHKFNLTVYQMISKSNHTSK